MTRLQFPLFALALFLVLPTATAQSGQPQKAHAALVHAIAVSPDGKTVATGGFDNLIKLWDLAPEGTLKEKKVLTGHTGPVYGLVFHPKEPILVSVSQDKTGRVWSLTEGKTIFELKGHTDIVDTVAISPDGKIIATGSADKSVKLWNTGDGKELKALGTHGGSVYSVAFSPDGKTLASAGADNLAKIWDVAAQKELMQLKGQEQPVTAVLFAANNLVVTASMDRTLRVWNATETKETKKVEAKDTKKTDDKKKTEDKEIKKKDEKEPKKTDDKQAKKADDKKEMKKEDDKEAKKPDSREIKKLGPTTDDPYAIAWWPKTKTLAVCGYSGLVTTWSLDDPKPKFSKKPIVSPGYCIAFVNDGKGVLTGHDNGTVVYTEIGK